MFQEYDRRSFDRTVVIGDRGRCGFLRVVGRGTNRRRCIPGGPILYTIFHDNHTVSIVSNDVVGYIR